MNQIQLITGITLFFIFLVFQAVLHAYDAALFYLSENELEKRASEGIKGAIRLKNMLLKPEKFSDSKDIFTVLSVLVTGGYIVHVVGTSVTDQESLSLQIQLVSAAAAFFILGIFGILIPKRLGKLHPCQTAITISGLVKMILVMIRPFTLVVQLPAHFILRLFGINAGAIPENVTEEEIITMVNEGQEQGVLEASEVEMITNIFELGDKSAGDIMTHRSVITAVEAESTLEAFIQEQIDGNYSRFPVFEDDIDHIVGTIHIRDALILYRNIPYRKKPLTQLPDLIRAPYFIPESRDIDDLLREMQAEKIHLGIVVDEYGQTAGVLSMEDIIEEIVGNIQDEYDVDEESIEQKAEDCYVVDGLMELEDVSEFLGAEIVSEEYETLNGLLISILDRIPAEDERSEIHGFGFTFRILEVSGNVIRKVEITRDKESNTEENDRNSETE